MRGGGVSRLGLKYLPIFLINNELIPYLIRRSLFTVELHWGLDGTYIKVNMSTTDRQRYQTRKGEVAMNILDVCDTNEDFVFALVGWEGSAADSHILQDAISRPNDLKVPKGNIKCFL